MQHQPSPPARVLLADVAVLANSRVYRIGSKKRAQVEARVARLAAAIIAIGVR